MGLALGITKHPAKSPIFTREIIEIEKRLYARIRMRNLLSSQFGTGYPPDIIRRACILIESSYNGPNVTQPRV